MKVLGAAAAVLGVSAASDVAEPPAAVETVDVIIIGAGMAGISSATELLVNNVTNFVILEASGRTGGRVESLQFGDEKVGKVTIEQGANWVHGIGPRNALWQIAEEIKLETSLVEGSTFNLSNYGIFNDGKCPR